MGANAPLWVIHRFFRLKLHQMEHKYNGKKTDDVSRSRHVSRDKKGDIAKLGTPRDCPKRRYRKPHT